MKLINYIHDGEAKLGIREAKGVLDVAKAAASLGASVPATITAAIEGGTEGREALSALVRRASGLEDCWLEEDTLTLGPSVTHPSKIICVGLNYRKHAEETNAAIPQYPILFNKFNNTLAAHGEDIPLPRVTDKVDYEAELVIVIGRQAKYVGREEALDYVFGYTCVNDLSARDLQMRTAQWLLGKSLDKFSPLGPYLVTADEIPDPNNLAISCTVNGEVRQRSNTSDMIFRCDEIVSYISQHMTLLPGDIILTGTPEGVVLGYPEERQVYLRPGDHVTIDIESIGSLSNRMAAE